MGRLVQACLQTFRVICYLQFQIYINHAHSVQMNKFLFRILPLHFSAVNHPPGFGIQVKRVSRTDHISGES